ncbi:spore germination protein [Paenibacillus daejeonensis]|uniref:spore germination protein n=1 Tax=Paenibacillus daejeonensis TaxID=135193 RepID=UPI000377ED12|nr:spore germination protein [Paenibacillus daejeonensis]
MKRKISLLEKTRLELEKSADVVFQPFKIGPFSCQLVYIQSIVNTKALVEGIISPLIRASAADPYDNSWLEQIERRSFFALDYKRSSDQVEVVDAVLSGYAVLFCDALPTSMLFPLTQYEKRSVPESSNEVVVVGPQRAFTEDIEVNMSLLRNIIKHPDLTVKTCEIGRYTKSKINIVYIEGLCRQELVDEIDKRLGAIELDGVLGMNYLAEFIEEMPYSPFPQYQYTERPDSVASTLIEGRLTIIQDGTPYALILPVTFFSLVQSAEDYYQRFHAASFIRLVRLLFILISFLLPSLYVAITTFHPEIVPTSLLITVAAARENIPFPALIEALIMELTFEGLREAGIRIPKPLGQTVSIIGGIVIGQAAVAAGIVSAPLVIVVSITGIASFIVPHYELSLAFRLLRFPILVLGGTLGILGVIVSLYLVYLYLVNLRSFGVPYMQPFAPFIWKDIKDTFIRVPVFLMKERPSSYGSPNRRRQGDS